uniref:Uncharacterized protein n=1 Tax=Octopus bimaculoides TaxID=37653 RepID=A0A0L8G5F0_OCTBM
MVALNDSYTFLSQNLSKPQRQMFELLTETFDNHLVFKMHSRCSVTFTDSKLSTLILH